MPTVAANIHPLCVICVGLHEKTEFKNSQFGREIENGFESDPGARVAREVVPRQRFGEVFEEGIVKRRIFLCWSHQ